MTTTSTFQGMDLNKPSSKVLAPPGGVSNVFFGSESTPAEQPKQQRAQQKPQAPPPQQDCSPAKPIIPQDTAGQTQMKLFGAGDPNPPKPTSGKRRFSGQDSATGFNLLTGEPSAPRQSNGAGGRKTQQKIDPANMVAAGGRIEDRQVTRKMPPGGHSSFSFGN